MTIAYWCVFAAILLPLLFTALAKFTGNYGPRANLAPREFLDGLDGFRKRANWAQLNTHESIPAFMAAVIIAHQMQGDQSMIDALAVSYIILRIVYGFLYMANKGLPRTIVWTAALLCTLAQFFTF
ncbi:MAG: MAPEG family protein [Gammaproteobacteria bacterium]|nr:MAPEG family protein [Gammaproteobacteria bacterium]